MTTGNVVLDGRQPVLGGIPSDQWLGLYSSRVWNGGDAPHRPFSWVYLTKPGDHTNPGKVKRYKKYTTAFRQPNYFSKTFVVERRFTVMTYYNNNSPGGVSTSKPTTVVEPVTFIQLIDNNKMNNLAARLMDAVNGGSGFNPAVFLGEAKQSLRMLGSSAVSLAKLMAKYRQRARWNDWAFRPLPGSPPSRKPPPGGYSYTDPLEHGRPGDLHDLAQRVLEFQYGWRPLIQDMYDAAEWLAAKMNVPKKQRFVVRTSKDKVLDPAFNQGAGLQYASCEAEAQAQIIAYIAESSGSVDLNLWTPAQVAWELLPYSFVCDWALPIGDWLKARGTSYALSGTFITTKTFVKRYQGVKDSPWGSWYTKTIRSSGGQGIYYVYKTIDRTVSDTLLSNISFPEFKGLGRTFSWEHCLNGVSLLIASPHLSPRDVLRKAAAWENTPVRSDFA